MPTYTVQIEASALNREIWQALAPAETVEDEGTPDEVAEAVARNQNIAEGGTWRVRVWTGKDADTGIQPAGEYERPKSEVIDELIDELGSIVAQRDRVVEELDSQRDALIRALMGTDVPRDRVAATAGLKVARLYQIRDGRR